MIFDAAVIGGGVTGAGVLRDLALRGIRAVLYEKSRPGHATTISSTHLIHGGLRYLLYDRLTTEAACWDSGHILRIARPLLTRLPILWPVYRDHRHGFTTVETLLESYDRLQPRKGGRTHLRMSAGETRRLVPGLKAEGLLGGLVFDEWWVDPVALVEANLASAERAGAVVRRGETVVGVARESGAVAGVRVRSADGTEAVVSVRAVVNAAGPWADEVAGLAGASMALRRRQGSHLVYDRSPLETGGRRVGLLLEAEDRERYVFVVPGVNMTLVGPTDLETTEAPDRLRTSEEEKRYLLASVHRYITDFPERFDRTLVGARPLLGQTGSEKLLSREFEVTDHGARDGIEGFFTVAGGKMSDFRLMGRAAADAVARRLGVSSPSVTDRWTLDGASLAATPGAPPGGLKRFLRRHPRLRELHALSYLGGALVRHLAGRCSAPTDSTVDDFDRHYS
jgi:glycerol-3-phosphate dehydrogenase